MHSPDDFRNHSRSWPHTDLPSDKTKRNPASTGAGMTEAVADRTMSLLQNHRSVMHI